LLEVARKADSDPWRDRFRQVHVWHDRQALEKLASQVIVARQSPQILEALSLRLTTTGGDPAGLLRSALVAYPRDFWLHFHLGALGKDPREQTAFYRVAVVLRPRASVVHNDLGNALRRQNDPEGAIRHFRKALELDPRSAPVHHNLGNALRDQKDLKGAIRAFRKAIELDPQFAMPLSGLGVVLHEQKDLEGAIRALRKALALDPNFAQAHNNLATALRDYKDLEGAIRHLRKALELDPNLAMGHYNLGNALREQNNLEGAVRHFRKALELNPNFAEAHCNLGGVLVQQGEFAEALKLMQKGHELGSRQPGWPYPSATWVTDLQKMVKLDARATAILQGLAKPANPGEQLALAELCQRKKAYAATVRFYAGAFQAAPPLAGDVLRGWRSQGARAAVLAASGQGRDASELDEAARTSLRQQALDWLQADLKLFTGPVTRGEGPALVLLALERLSQWQRETDLASVREEKELARLPPASRRDWERFWTDVRQLQRRAAACFREDRLSGKLTAEKREQPHEVKLQAGKTYLLDLQSKHFDAFLRLEDDQGKKLAEDDDSGGGTNARIVFTATEAGSYRVIATSFRRAGLGDYTLLLREFTPPGK
jgi:tetratricopeptide (TPR) repeat protein